MKLVTQKNINISRIKCGFYFCDYLSNRILPNLFLRLTHPNCILQIKFMRFRAKIAKISPAIIYSAIICDRKNFCP